MVNVTVLTQSQRKCILRYTCEDYLAYITLVEVIPTTLTLSFSILKQLIKEGGTSSNKLYLTISILVLSSIHL